MEVKLILNLEEVNAILAALGKLPTDTGVYPLALKVKSQAESQVPREEEKTA